MSDAYSEWRKDAFNTEVERDAWQKGFDCCNPNRGAKPPVLRRLDQFAAGTRQVIFDPRSQDMLEKLVAALPEHMRRAAIAGWIMGSITAAAEESSGC